MVMVLLLLGFFCVFELLNRKKTCVAQRRSCQKTYFWLTNLFVQAQQFFAST